MGSRLYLVLDDLKLREIYGDKTPRPYTRHGLPSTVPIYTKAGKKGQVSLSKRWMRWLRLINSTPNIKGYEYQFTKHGMLKDAVGWHNVGKGNRVEPVTFSGNVVAVTRVEGIRAYIKCFYNTDTPPKEIIRSMPGYLHPIVQLLTTQYRNKLDITTDGRYPQTFIIATSRKQELWIDKRNLIAL